MAPWGRNPEVRPYYLELWAYLSARAAGELPQGEPRPRARILALTNCPPHWNIMAALVGRPLRNLP